MIEIKTDPTAKEVRVFGLLWLLFFAAVGGVAWWKPQGLVGAAVVLGSAWLVSLVFNRVDRRSQLLGVLLPALFGSIGGAVQGGVPLATLLGAVWGVGAIGALAVWALPAFGRRLYVGWLLAAAPIGWTISHLVLAAVFYCVLTPIGLLMRLFGHDPMRRRFDRAATSYWIQRKGTAEAARYFRQF